MLFTFMLSGKNPILQIAKKIAKQPLQLLEEHQGSLEIWLRTASLSSGIT